MVSNYFFTSSTALLCGLLASSGSIIPTANGALLPRQVLSPDTTNIAPSNVPTLTATSVSVPTAAFGSFIEGAAVDADGNLFAADFRAGNLTPSSSYGYFFERQVGTTNVLDLSQNPIFNAAAGDIGDTAENPPLIAGARFLRDGSLLVTGEHASYPSRFLLLYTRFPNTIWHQMLQTNAFSRLKDPF